MVLAILAISCGEKPATVVPTQGPAEQGVAVTVEVSAGTGWADTGSYIPVPANVATINDHKVLILSDAIEVGTSVNIIPLAVAKLKEEGKVNHYIVSIPAAVSQRTNGINDFSDFTTRYSSAKWIIEQYIVSRNGLGKASLVGWEDAAYVKNNLLPVDK